jgi:release factor glutamine methyltransferase
VAIAVNRPDALVTAIDLSAQSLSVASANASLHGVSDRVRFVQADLLSGVAGPFDAIIANPPYVKQADLRLLQPEVAEYEPRLALDGGPDGLRCIEAILRQAQGRLSPEGLMLIEIGWNQGPEAQRLARHYFPRHNAAIIQDYSANERLLRVSTEKLS